MDSFAQTGSSPYTILASLGVNGSTGVKGSIFPAADWPQILSGFGGPVAIDPTNSANWYVNNQAGVSIHLCSQATACTPSDFGVNPVVDDTDVGGDGLTMSEPAPFLVDPLDPTQLLIGTCRVWRGPADGIGWSSTNVISGFLDGGRGSTYCDGDALIRTMAAKALSGNKEVIYAGMFGSADGGGGLSGHILSATIDPFSSTAPIWSDLTLNPVTNDTNAMNYYEMDISSIFIDPLDATGNTVYVTVEGMKNIFDNVQTIYRTTDGGAHWASVMSNLPSSPANSVVV